MSENYDGGEAILEAFRNLGVDYIISSPGSEWPPVWEALARQRANELDGPKYIDCWHESLAVAMAMGYTGMPLRVISWPPVPRQIPRLVFLPGHRCAPRRTPAPRSVP